MALSQECATFYGDIIIGPGSSGEFHLDGLTNLTGSIRPAVGYPGFYGTQMASLRSNSLLSIGGDIQVYNAPLIESIRFPNLQTLGERLYVGNCTVLNVIDLPSLQTLNLWLRLFLVESLTTFTYPQNIPAPSQGIGITNTALKSISGFSSTPGGVYFQNNPLQELSLDITEAVFLAPNNLSSDGIGLVQVDENPNPINVSLPNLVSTGGGMSISNCSALSIPALNSINGSFVLENATFESVAAPNLGFINGTLNITGSFTG